MTGPVVPDLWDIIVYFVKLPFRWLWKKVKGDKE